MNNQQEIFMKNYGSLSPQAQALEFQSLLYDQVDIPDAPITSGFMETAGAFFRQSNTFRNAMLAMDDSMTVEDPSYDPTADPLIQANSWIKEVYPSVFASINTSGSALEAKLKIDRVLSEHNDRRIIENAGTGTALSAGLFAGLSDPINYIALGSALRAAKAATLASRPLAVGAVGAAENVAALSLAEPFLQAGQLTRSEDEFLRDLVGGAVLGFGFGSVAGSMSSGRVAMNRALIGADSAEDVLDPNSVRGVIQNNPDLGKRIDDFIESDQGFAALAEVPEEAQGILLEITKEINPELARVIGSTKDNFFGRMLTRFMFLNPTMNLARSESQFARTALDVLVKPAIVRQNTVDRQSVESVLMLAETAAMRVQHRIDEVISDSNVTRSALNVADRQSLTKSEILEMAGKAAVRGDEVDIENPGLDFLVDEATGELIEVNPFTVVRDGQRRVLNQAEIDVVKQVADINRKFSDAIRKTAIESGAFTAEELDESLIRNYLQRRYKQAKIDTNREAFESGVFKALEHKQRTLLPDLESEQSDLRGDLERIEMQLLGMEPDDPQRAAVQFDADYLTNQIAEYQTLIEQLGNKAEWQKLANKIRIHIADNLTDDGDAFRQTNSLRNRVLEVEDRFLAGFIENDVKKLQQQQVRVILPQVMAATQMDSTMDGFRLNPGLQAKYTATTKKLEQMNQDPNVSFDDILQVRLELEEILDDASHLKLQVALRLNRELEAFGKITSQAELQEQLNNRVQLLKRQRREWRASESALNKKAEELRLLVSDFDAVRASNPNDTRLPDMELDIEVLEMKVKTLRKETNKLNKKLSTTRDGINEYANNAQRGPESKSDIKFDYEETKFGANTVALEGVTEVQQLRSLLNKNKARILKSVSDSRRLAFQINNSSEQLKVQVNRDYDEQLKFKKKQREKEKLAKKRDRDLDDLAAIFNRMRNQKPPGEKGGRVGKTIRDWNYLRLGGGFLISSIPDLAVGVGMVTLPTYMRSLARYLTEPIRKLLGKPTTEFRADASEYLYAAEAVLGGERNRRIGGLDPLDPDRDTAFERASAIGSEKFGNFLGLNLWNGMMKDINAMAIESRIFHIANKVRNNKKLKRSEKMFLEGSGLQEDQLVRWSILQEAYGRSEKTLTGSSFYFSGSKKWSPTGAIDENQANTDRLALDRFIFQKTNQTIVTPGAGDLPRWMTDTEFGRLAGQFGSFSMAATNQVLLPMMQKFALGDMNQALMFVGTSTLGAASYWLRQALSGKDPFEDEVKKDRSGKIVTRVPWWKKSIVEGIDRGGTLGWISQGNAILERMTGFGVSTLTGTGALTRMQARSRVDTVLGPTAGFINDITAVAGATVDKVLHGEPFTEGDYNASRRMLWFQNLHVIRLGLDIAPSLLEYRQNPSKFNYEPMQAIRPLQQRIRDNLQGL